MKILIAKINWTTWTIKNVNKKGEEPVNGCSMYYDYFILKARQNSFVRRTEFTDDKK